MYAQQYAGVEQQQEQQQAASGGASGPADVAGRLPRRGLVASGEPVRAASWSRTGPKSWFAPEIEAWVDWLRRRGVEVHSTREEAASTPGRGGALPRRLGRAAATGLRAVTAGLRAGHVRLDQVNSPS